MWGLMQLLCLEFPRRVLQEYLVNSAPLSMYALLLDMVEVIGDDQECWGGATSGRNFGIVLEFTLPSHKYVSLTDPILGTSTAEITEWWMNSRTNTKYFLYNTAPSSVIQSFEKII
uniref:ATP binding protein n=1 Tax=Solanum tuberosum TaxID=4113 RepID=M1AYQ5_SOLTU